MNFRGWLNSLIVSGADDFAIYFEQQPLRLFTYIKPPFNQRQYEGIVPLVPYAIEMKRI